MYPYLYKRRKPGGLAYTELTVVWALTFFLQFKNWFIYFLLAFVVVTLREYILVLFERCAETT